MEEFINCPGLNHIAKNIIVCLNGVDINACCHVNESWRDFINHQKIWEQNLRKKLDNAARQIPDIYEKLNANERTILDWKNFIENVLSSKDRQTIRLVANFTQDYLNQIYKNQRHRMILPPIHWASI